MMNNELLNIFSQIIETKKQEIDSKFKDLFGNLNDLNDNILSIIEEPDKIFELDLNILSENIDIEFEVVERLKLYQKFARSTLFRLEDKQKETIIEYLNDFSNKLKEIINNRINDNLDYINLNSEYNKLTELFNKLKNNEILTKEEFILCSQIIKDNVSDINLSLELIKNLSLNICLSYENSNDLDEEKIIHFTNLNEEEVKNLFLEFGLDFNNFKEKDKERLLLYGSLSNIMNILSLIKDNNITINIEEYSSALSEILILSNEDNVSTIISHIKEDLGILASDEYHISRVFRLYLKSPSIFVSGLKRYQERRVNDKNTEEKENPNIEFRSGKLNNYILVRQLLLELGIDIPKAMDSCSTIFTESYKKVKTNVDYFTSYGIDKKVFLECLSSLISSNPLDIIDQYIEAGFYDYLINCFSYVRNSSLNSPMLYQLINARKSGWTDAMIFKDYGCGDNYQQRRRVKELEKAKINTKSLDGEPEYHSEIESKYYDMDFSIQEPINDIVLNNHFIKKLEENFKHSDLVYDFNGVIISRYKVLRYYANLLKNRQGGLDTLKYCILKNAIITKEQYDIIMNCLSMIFDYTGKRDYTKLKNNYLDVDFSSIIEFEDEFLNNYFIRLLEENFKENNLMYNFEGVIIPRYDVLNNFAILLYYDKVMPNPLEGLMYSIIKDKNLNRNQCEIIAKCLNDKVFEGEKKLW